MLSKVCKERLEYLASLKGHVGQAVTMCRVELSDISTELLSLREQLAELKALEPFGYIDAVHNWNYTNLKSELNTVAFISKTPDELIRPDYGMALFTAAKPAAGLGVEDITEFMRKAFWRGFESARGTENSNIPE
ncbi:TPA: hypothetical protein ACY4ZU_003998, partial [Yersinia enterocolitica]|nr:hypothetical protein [Yersinia enterocolitica]HDW3131410.1 hypothetical protein [Yersinia enterocolitica]